MAERTERINLHVHLTGDKYIVGNGYAMWVVEETVKTNKKGDPETVQRRLSGYHNRLGSLIDSYINNSVTTAEIDGELEDLAALLRDLREEVSTWREKMEGAAS